MGERGSVCERNWEEGKNRSLYILKYIRFSSLGTSAKGF